MSGEKTKDLGDLLMSEGLGRRGQVEEARALAQARGCGVASALVDIGALSERSKNELLKKRLGVDSLASAGSKRGPEALGALPKSDAKRLRAIPLRVEDGKLLVAMEDPAQAEVVEYVELVSGFPVRPLSACRGDIERALKDYPDDAFEGFRLRDHSAAAQLFLTSVFAVVFFMPAIAVGWAYFESEALQESLSLLGKPQIAALAFALWCVWAVVVWFVFGAIFSAGVHAEEEEGEGEAEA